MKKKLYTVLCLLLALALPFAAFAEAEEEMDLELEGFVTEIVEEGFILDDVQRGEVMLNVSDATVWDGMVTADTLEAGQYVLVQYDGRMTFSRPPQAHADRVGMYALEGSVAEVYEDGMLLQGDPIHGDVLVNFAEAMPHVHQGMIVTVWYDGVMALSLPGRVTARSITVPQITGAVSEKTDDSFVLTDEGGMQYQVLLNEGTLIGLKAEEAVEEEIAEEVTEEVVEETSEENEQVEEEEQVEDLEEEERVEDLESEVTAEPERMPVFESELEWGEGDVVTVYYNGMMTRSIPAGVTALEIVVEK